MDFKDTPTEAAWRREVREFIRTQLPDELRPDEYGRRERGGDMGDLYGPGSAAYREWARRLAGRGWVAPAWPTEYGGAGMSVMEQFVFNQEMAEARAPGVGSIGMGLVGPTLIFHGTDAQRRRYLPPILAGDELWCQGYSEPGSGSDLASLQTRAVRDGDDYVVNGQKIWTSGGHVAQWMILLARTDPDAPKHRGISYFIFNMKQPGVTVRPLVNMAGGHEFNEVFFENARVPRENLIGEENRGWYHAQTTLSFERSGIAGAVARRQTLDDLIRFAREDARSALRRRPALRHELAERYVEAQAGLTLAYKIVSLQARDGVVPGHEASVGKIFGTELNQRIYNTAMKMLGLFAQLNRRMVQSDPVAHYLPLRGRIEYNYLRAVANTIEGGTSEIQRTIIATRGLGLPRS